MPVLEGTLGTLSVFGAAGVCAAAWVGGTSVRHGVGVVEPAMSSELPDRVNAWLDRTGDAVIVVTYVISVALSLRIMAQYVVGHADPGAFAAYYAIQAVLAMRTSTGRTRGGRTSWCV